MKRGQHPNSLANLRKAPPFVKGFDPRRSVSMNVGESLLRWMGRLDEHDDSGRAKYTHEQLETIVDDHTLARSKRAAAAQLLRLTSVEWAKNGLPLANADLERVMDRTIGKPKQTIDVVRRVEGPSLPDVIKEAQAIAKQLGQVVVDRMVSRLEEEQAQRDNCQRALGPASSPVDTCQAEPASGSEASAIDD